MRFLRLLFLSIFRKEKAKKMISLKATLLSILDAIYPVASNTAKAIIELARWAIDEFVPESITVPPPKIGAAPGSMKDFITELFDLAMAKISNPLLNKAVAAAAYLVINYGLDKAWDIIFPPAKITIACTIGNNEVKQALDSL